MEARLIMLPKPVLVSDEEIEKGDWFYHYSHGKSSIHLCEAVVGKSLVIQNKESSCWSDYSKQILADAEGLPKLDLSLIAKGIGWVDVEKLALKEYPKDLHRWAENQFDDFNESDRNTWINGFKAAQSLNEKNYSEEDMIEFAHFCRDYFTHLLTINEKFNLWLSNRKPKEYLVEYIQEGNTIKVTKIVKQS